MEILIITFRLSGLSREAYAAHAAQIAPAFTTVPGLIAKYWLADDASNTYGGVYLWQDRGSRDRYLESDLFRGLTASPHFAEVSVRPFDTLAAPTAITGALVRAEGGRDG
jgi:hypothetical protein